MIFLSFSVKYRISANIVENKQEIRMDNIIKLLEKMPLNQLGCVLCINFGEAKLYIDGNAGSVSRDLIDGVAATIHVSEDDLEKVITGEENAISLFTTGRTTIEGDTSVAFKLKDLLG